MISSLEIAQAATLRPVTELASELGLEPEAANHLAHWRRKPGPSRRS